MKWLLVIAAIGCARADSVCDSQKFAGAYGFQLSGTTAISGSAKPVATIGRLVFDGSGAVSGYSTVNFTGLLLGNPVTGSYDAHADCSLNWSLQDDSGALQHFSGSMSGDMMRVQFHQTDQGGAAHGIMIKTPPTCGATALHKRYTYTISGSTTPMLPGETAHPVSSSGAIEIADGGKVTLTPDGPHTASDGSVEVDGECVTNIQLGLSVGDSGATVTMKLRGVLLDEGKQILAIQTDPGTTVTANFTAHEE